MGLIQSYGASATIKSRAGCHEHGLTNSPSNAATCVAYLRNHAQTSPSFLCVLHRKLGEVWTWFLRYATQVAALEGLFVRPCLFGQLQTYLSAKGPRDRGSVARIGIKTLNFHLALRLIAASVRSIGYSLNAGDKPSSCCTTLYR